ncbi:MAG: acetoin utilization protein AcuC [Magnetococcales bacterium]|nr:acetoin utilization protein AcuC [Magnetococcales bacterium]
MNSAVCVYIGEQIARYGFGSGHPFGTDRMDAFWEEAQRQGVANLVSVRDPVLAQQADLELFHTADYVSQVMRQSKTGDGFLDYGDTPAFKGVYEAAAHVVGSTLDATDRIMNGQCRRAFVPIAGLHHARRDRAGGFCVFNDCGIVIAALRKKYGLKKIAYVDIDAHHGDGVFYGYEDDPDLVFADMHEDGRFLYPGTGHSDETGIGAAKGTKLNLPLLPESDDTTFFQNWSRIEDFLNAQQPEFIILQCGADSVTGDPITHMQFSSAAHGHAASRLCHLAESYGHGRVLATGGGGYNRKNIGKAWCAVVQSLVDAPIDGT